ncbi:class I SAM-dependent methyltransferase [Subtercola sp. PAMC28395]|uniref:class I SAM-dependent methyltransferase n=1 Tax=Subtercola sp. PAMC28395 TaxID=2846775 RepID=UPI001C0D4FCA|nr:class I SAM-dependent methyltransferase [Subtercola sp. PAMC28395]QWT24133.1 class I SAM-dependent methyltransferase [Subtercola sp. PAMC28395]
MHEHSESSHAETVAAQPNNPQEFWEGHYGQRDQIWSGNPNPLLVREAERLPAGRALDLGCGEGADAVWLATQGWQVTAVDVSSTALERGRAAAVRASVDELIDWQQHDLGESFPDAEFDLVSAQFLQSPIPLDRERILQKALDSLAPGGSLLIVGHAEFPPWSKMAHAGEPLPSAQEVLDSLHLDPRGWVTKLCSEEPRSVVGPDGNRVTLVDSVVMVTRATPSPA